MKHGYIRFNKYVAMWWGLMLLFVSHIIIYMLDSQISTIKIYSDPFFNGTYKLTYYVALLIAMYVICRRPRIDSIFLWLVLIMVGLQLISVIINHNSLKSSLPDIFLWPLLLFDSYQLQKLATYSVLRGKEKLLYVIVAIMCCCSLPLTLIHLAGDDPDGGKIFPLYFLLMFIPILLSRKKSFIRNLLLLVIAVLVIMSTKRAGIMILLFNFAGNLIGRWRQNRLTKNRFFFRIGVIFALAGIFIGVIELLDFFNIGVIDRFMNISEDGASGRDLIWATVLAGYSNFRFLNKLFGKGYHAVIGLNLQERHILAHNDFIEFLYDFGILTVVLEIFMCLFLFFVAINLYRKRSNLCKYYIMFGVDFIILASFSYFMVQSEIISVWAMGLGILLADTPKK